MKPRQRNEHGALSNQLLIGIVIAIIVIIVLFFVLRDQGKDDEKNEPGVVTSQFL